MIKPLIIAFIFLFSVSSWAQDPVTSKIEQIYKQYLLTRRESQEVKIKHLIQLDQELRALIDEPWMKSNKAFDKKFWKEKYQKIGIEVGHYSEELEYSGKLLVEAHALDVDGTNGSYTRYADICGGWGSFSDCDMPNIKVAKLYEKEFPQGPFIEDTLIIIGNFYDDLFKALKTDYKNDCFSTLLSKITGK